MAPRVTAAVAALAAALAAARPTLQPLFSAYQGYPPCYRQPVLVVLDESRLVAFAEGRNNSRCSGTDDGNNSSIRVRASSDGGATWSAEQEIMHGRPGANQPDYLSAVHDAETGRTHLFVQAFPNVWTFSDDGGATWSAPVPPKVTIPDGFTATPGVAHGIQLVGELCSEPTCAGLTGRLLVAWVCHAKKSEETEVVLQRRLRAHARGTVACAGCYSCLAYSDDHGESWTVDPRGITSQEGTREASLVQLLASAYGAEGAVVYASERNLGNETGMRLHALSVDGGTTFASVGADPAVPDVKVTDWTGIVAGATRFDGPNGAARRLVISTPQSKTDRADMALFTSHDEAKSWSAGVLYRAGPAGYSDVGALNSTHGVILFENGEDEFAQRISFGYFTADDLMAASYV